MFILSLTRATKRQLFLFFLFVQGNKILTFGFNLPCCYSSGTLLVVTFIFFFVSILVLSTVYLSEKMKMRGLGRGPAEIQGLS